MTITTPCGYCDSGRQCTGCPQQKTGPDATCCGRDKRRTAMPPLDSVMLDIETMGTSRHRALILSWHAVEFNVKDCLGSEFGAPYFGNAIKAYPNLRQQFAKGRCADDGTQKFWRDQSPEARADWANRREDDCVNALEILANFIRKRDVWAHGICFDIGNLEGLYEDFGVILPWKYNLVFDERTITRRFPTLRKRPADFGKGVVQHIPESDNLTAVYDLWERWPAKGIAP